LRFISCPIGADENTFNQLVVDHVSPKWRIQTPSG
jgi:hypothetical protein